MGLHSGPMSTPARTVAALLILTAGTGMVDAVSYLGLGHVFVANMTGNVVFLGFAADPASGLSAMLAVIALLAFMLGAAVGGAAGHRLAAHRIWPGVVVAAQALLLAAVAAAFLIGLVDAQPSDRPWVVAALALAFGLQNSTARRMGVPDLTTTVLTLTVTGLAADARRLGGPGAKPLRRLSAIAAMLGGAAIGALLLQVSVAGTIAVAAGCVLVAGALLLTPAPTTSVG